MTVRLQLIKEMVEPLLDIEFDKRTAKAWLADQSVNLIARSARVASSVSLGRGNVIMPGALLTGRTIVGDRNIFLGAVQIGSPSRQRVEIDPHGPEPSEVFQLSIGNDNIFEDHVSIHLPVASQTRIADSVSVGAGCHIAHDCVLERETVLGANCSIGGYVWIGPAANLGLSVTVHPRVAVGAYSMCGAGCSVIRHVLPAATVAGTPARYIDVNLRGLKRAGHSSQEISVIQELLWRASTDPTQWPEFCEFGAFHTACRKWGRDCGTVPSGTPM